MSSERDSCIPGTYFTPVVRCGEPAPEGIEIRDILLLTSLLPCCAQIALPYWAKITGTIENSTRDDKTILITASLVSDKGVTVERYSDVVDLEGGESSSFEIKLIEFKEDTTNIAIAAQEGDIEESA